MQLGEVRAIEIVSPIFSQMTDFINIMEVTVISSPIADTMSAVRDLL